jgi:plasmid maintenance system antidote protein VapI
MVRVHLYIEGRRTTASLDKILAERLARHFEAEPGSDQAHAAIRKWAQAEIDGTVEPGRSGVSQWLLGRALLLLTQPGASNGGKPARKRATLRSISLPAPHPATVLQDEVLPVIGLSTHGFAPHIGRTKQALSKSAIMGERLKNDTVHRIAKALGVPPLYMLLLQVRFDLTNFNEEDIAGKVEPVDVSEIDRAAILRRVDAFYAEFESLLAQARQECAADLVTKDNLSPVR